MQTAQAVTVTGFPALLIILAIMAVFVTGIVAIVRFLKRKATREPRSTSEGPPRKE
ncbi:hypothetical protein [Terrabacter sp. 2YAF2]|uniref:hypothetical protein n=1 Tax=Terrabacter sp. 2YAF2 TaxID=3233026 RepID=UPI003F991545